MWSVGTLTSAMSGRYTPPVASGAPSAAGVTSAGMVAVTARPCPTGTRLALAAPLTLMQSGFTAWPARGGRVQRLQLALGVVPSPSMARAVTVVVPPGPTSGGSALMASTRRPATYEGGGSDDCWHPSKQAAPPINVTTTTAARIRNPP